VSLHPRAHFQLLRKCHLDAKANWTDGGAGWTSLQLGPSFKDLLRESAIPDRVVGKLLKVLNEELAKLRQGAHVGCLVTPLHPAHMQGQTVQPSVPETWKRGSCSEAACADIQQVLA